MNVRLWDELTAFKQAKYTTTGVERTVPPLTTIARVAPLLEVMGVSRVAEITGLDRVGIPNFTTVRPRERGRGISYYNGKGVTRDAAHAGALMEAVERFSGESCHLPIHCAPYEEIRRRGPAVDPADIIAPLIPPGDCGTSLEWVIGDDLLTRRETFVPLEAVVCPYEAGPGATAVHVSHTNGLASGNTRLEAVCHGLCEVIERHAYSQWLAASILAPAVMSVLATVGRGQTPHPEDAVVAHPLIDADSLPGRSAVMLRRLQRAGLLVYLRDLSSAAMGVATIDCVLVDPQPGGAHLVHSGAGTHPDARVALNRALSEAAQSRLSHIQGGREDLDMIVVNPEPFDPDSRFGLGARHDFADVPSSVNGDISGDLAHLLGRLNASGCTSAIAVDLTHPRLGVPVYRVLVPTFETWGAFFSHGRRPVYGRRTADFVRHLVDRARLQAS